MPDVDLAAIRADLATLAAVPGRSVDLVEYEHVQALIARVVNVHAPALLTAVGVRDGRIRRLQKAARDARNDADCYRNAHRDRQGLPSDPRHAGCRAAEVEPVPPRVVGVLDEAHVWRDDEPIGCLGVIRLGAEATDTEPSPPTESAAVCPLETT